MDPLAYPVFQLVSSYIRSEFEPLMTTAYTNFVGYVGIIALAVETLFIMNEGFTTAFDKSTEDVKTNDIRELIYHFMVVCLVLALLRNGTMFLDGLMSLRSMVIEGLTGFAAPGGQQAEQSLQQMSVAFAASNFVNSIYLESAPDIKKTAVTLAIVGEVAPTITGGLLVMLNELMTYVAMGLFPLAMYLGVYKSTDDMMYRWFRMVAGLSIHMAALAVVLVMARNVTIAFVAVFSAMVIAQNALSGASGVYISELQQSIISAGFGLTLSVLMLFFPSNVMSFSGASMHAGGLNYTDMGALRLGGKKKWGEEKKK
jgi:hypothetical protein